MPSPHRADPQYLGVLMTSPQIGPDGVTLRVWWYPHPTHGVDTIQTRGYWQPVEIPIRVGDIVIVQSRYGTPEQHTSMLVRTYAAPGVVVMSPLSPAFGFGAAA